MSPGVVPDIVIHVFAFNPRQFCELGNVIPILYVRKLRLKKVQGGHIICKGMWKFLNSDFMITLVENYSIYNPWFKLTRSTL